MRLAIVVSHPIPNFAQLYREIARIEGVELRVYFCCDWGLREYVDPGFGVPVTWDTPLLDGYDSEFLPIRRRPRTLGFWEVDNPGVGEILDRFDPDVAQISGYAHRTNWRVARWARRNGKNVLYASDSNSGDDKGWLRRAVKQVVVRWFYGYVDGALYVSERNRKYHERYGVRAEQLFRWVLPIDREGLLSSVPDRAGARRAVRERLGIPADAFVALLVAKYARHKRPLDLVAAANDVTPNGRNVWSLLVGEGPERVPIEEYCKRTGTRNAVLTGFVNQSEIGSYYAASDVLVLPSEVEPYGLVVTEGACFGLPLIVSDRVGCVGPNDIAQPGRNARVFRCGDVEQLRECLEACLLNHEAYDVMAATSLHISTGHDVRVAARILVETADRVRSAAQPGAGALIGASE